MKKIENTIKTDGLEITTYNNIDLDLSLSFNSLTYTLSYENNKNYLINNSLLFNIEDIDTIYNIFKTNDVQFSYQLNNILFIDNNKNMHILSYNLITDKIFSYNNNLLTFNITNNSINSIKEFNEQPIFAYNSNKISYIYSNENQLKYISLNKPGLYNIDGDDIILNNDRLSINVNKFNYDCNHINNTVNKINNIIYKYNDNVNLFGETKKYRDSANINNLELITNNDGKEINFITSNQNYKLNYNSEGLDIIIKDDDHFIIDLPVEYQYETLINKDFKFNQTICPVKINNIKIKVNNTNIKSKINFNKSKSFIHDHKPISIINNYEEQIHPYILTEKCNVSLYFNIEKSVYEEVYKLDKLNVNNYKFNLEIEIQNITYKFNCYIDVMNNQFKKLYHDYNYGFNYDNHGDAIGIMMLPKYINEDLKHININKIQIGDNLLKAIDNNLEFYPTSKDIYLNYDSKYIDNIFIPMNDIDYTEFNQQSNFINFNKMSYYSSNNIEYNNINNININEGDSYPVIKDLIYPQRLKYKNLTLLYKKTNQTIYKYNYQNNISDLNTKKLLLNSLVLHNIGTLCKFKLNNNKSVNNPYIMEKDKHKLFFNNIFNYRKSGLLNGDFYTPCLSDYMSIYLFGIENYFDQDVYQRYINKFYSNNTQNRLFTNQFYRGNYSNDICQYSLNLTKNPYNNRNTDSNPNNDLFEFNKYYIELYQAKNKQETDNNYIWPLFRIPDYSIINSNDYIIMYNEKENCEYVDYYIKPSNKGNYFNINFKSYINKDSKYFSFKILNEKMKVINSSQISSINLIDKENNIYQMQIYMQNISKINILYIIFTDSEDYMNNITINKENYRILCKVYLKNKDI